MQPHNWDYEGMWVLKVKVISLPYIFQVLYVLCFTEPRYQVRVYMTIGPLVLFSLATLSRLFHSYRDEPIGRWGETGVPQENHLTHPQAELGLSHMWPVRGLNLHQTQWWDDWMIEWLRALKFSDLTHGVASFWFDEDKVFQCISTTCPYRVHGGGDMCPVVRKPVFGVSDQVRHKPGCTATEDG